MNRWLYSTPNDQFGAKPYSNPTPTVPPQRVALAEASSAPVSVIEDAKAVACHRRAALYVEQRCIPGVADLAGKEADAIGLGASGERRIEQADALVAEIRPIALGFQAKHPLTGLPAITDLAADEAPGPLAAAVSDGYASRINEIPAVAALTPAAVAADVEAGPVVNRRPPSEAVPWYTDERPYQQPWRERPSREQANQPSPAKTSSSLNPHLSCASLKRTIPARAPIEY